MLSVSVEMTRKCSHCGHNGHNSRTCPNKGVKIFGVRLTDGPIRKSASMGNLLHYSTGSSASASNNNNSFGHGNNGGIVEGHVNADGYLSDGLVHNSSSNSRGERKKGVPWTEEEHRMFLIGLQKLGKGDWRGISRNFVPSRTPTQVASHAQKYFIRQSNLNRRKRRSSLFDITTEGPSLPTPSPVLPVMSSRSNSDQEEPESFEISSATTAESNAYAKNSEEVAMAGTSGYGEVPFYQGFVAPYVPFVGFPMWSPFTPAMPQQPAPVYRPTAVVSTAPMKVDDCSGLSQLSLGDNPSKPSAMEPSELSLKLHDQPSRQSAFQATPPINDKSSFNSRTNVISVV